MKMASPAVTIGTILAGICFLLDVIGVSTDYWFVVTNGWNSGLFRVCVSKVCLTYIAYDETFLNVNYLATAGCSCIACVLLLVACLIGLCGCNKPYDKPIIQNIGGVCLTAGIFGTIGFVWYYMYFFRGTFGGTLLFSNIGNPGWSFFLSAVASSTALLVGIIFVIIGCNMPVQGGAVFPGQQPTAIVMQNQQQQMQQMQPSAPPQQQMSY